MSLSLFVCTYLLYCTIQKTTAYELPFRKNKDRGVLCKLTLTKKEHYKLRQAILKEWYFQMYYDDLPFWGFIGKKENDHTYVQDASKKDDGDHMLAYVFTHINFHVKYNGNHVIEISLSTLPEQSTLLDKIGNYDKEEAKPVELEYTYSVDWEFTETTFDERMGKYRKHSLHPHHLEIHWFSILNSCVTVLLLTGFLATILMRILKSDFAKYSKDVDDELGAADAVEDSGWKFVHGDVFRFPAHKFLLCAIVGTGTQLLCLVCAIGTLALMGFYYPYNRGAMLATGVVLYGLSTFISGYYAVKLYTQLKGENWIRMVLITAAAFTLPFMGVFSYLNTVALAYNSTAALPFGTILILTIGWIVIGFPLTVIGGIMGKESKEEFSAPCRTTKYPREIPELPWYRSTFPQMMIAGFLPFSAIYIELYYIFASVWGHKIYTIYSILCIVFAILLIVTAFMTIAITYFQLAVEDYQWWWRSVFCGGAVSVFVFMYAVYYYHFRSDMDGWMQTSFFFGYMAVACYGLFMMLGMVGFRSALMFCKYIYQNIKTD